jgi:predicted Fe-Mo cluster-binding NifX family protein
MKRTNDMKIAFPTQENMGMDSLIFGHFGSAHYFIVVDSDDDTFESADNPDREHQHGQCQPLKALAKTNIDSVVVGGIGAGALKQLNAAGIKVYRAVEGTISENLELIKSGLLPLLTLDQTCVGHAAGDKCMH